ncbi:unnamed protein product [Urochloa decumbens]|uniref:Protein LURP-one-related 15 n=1 Tax=Urochloa decumbens TaxID=240449 RepID=A0ABC9F127_9POAL
MAAPYGAPPQALAAPAPVAVVSPQFCAPYAVPLTVVKKAISLSGGDFVVTDANGAEMLRVKGAVFSMHDRRVLRDAAGRPLVSMREKVFSMHNRWEVFRGDSANASDLLFTVKKASVFQLKTELDVFLAGNTAQQACDFKIRGSYFERSCAFYLGDSNTMIAQVSTHKFAWFSSIIVFYIKILQDFNENVCFFVVQTNRKYTVTNVLLEKDTFVVNVFPHVDYVFITALVVILDEIHRERFDD